MATMERRSPVFDVLGEILVALPPCRGLVERLLSTWHTPAARGPLARLLFDPVFDAWVRRRYLPETDPDVRERLKMICMAGESGRSWAEDYNRGDRLVREEVEGAPFSEADPSLDALDAACAAAPDDAVVVQIGCSSGRQIAWFAARHPRLRFVGFDVDHSIIDYVADVHRLPNLEFLVGFAQAMPDILDRHRGWPSILFSHGSLQYVQPEHLDIFFRDVAARSDTLLILLEPGSAALGPPEELEGSHWRWNFSYTHNYRHYAERHGLVTTRLSIDPVHRDDAPDSADRHTVTYFYEARTAGGAAYAPSGTGKGPDLGPAER